VSSTPDAVALTADSRRRFIARGFARQIGCEFFQFGELG